MKPFNNPWSGISNEILGISVDQGAAKLPDGSKQLLGWTLYLDLH